MDAVFHYSSPLGNITLASDGSALKGLWFDGQAHDRSTLSSYEEKDLPVFRDTVRWLDMYFDGKIPGFTPDIILCGTPYQKEIWNILRDIPYGETKTYKEISDEYERRYGRKTSPRAAGNAVGRNPVSLLVPCHRVVGTGGRRTGYAGGLDRKAYLLVLEQNTVNSPM